MNARSRRCRLSVRLVLLAVLLLAQGLLLAHEIDHFAAPDSGLCAVCQIGHGLDSPVVSAPASPPASSDESIPFHHLARSHVDGYWHACQARAPPHALSA